VREASGILGISEHAIRQRIRRNTLEAIKSADGRVYVLLDRDAEPSDEPSYKASDETSGVGPVQMLREHNQVLREQLDEAHAANRENRRIIAALTSRIPEIEAPREARDAAETVSEDGEGADTPTDRGERETGVQRRSWWRRFFGFE
jgi:hypothetical protein